MPVCRSSVAFLALSSRCTTANHGPAHFHAIYGDFEITVEIESGRVNGAFPKRAQAHVLEWLELHRIELLEAWSLARSSRPLPRIDPLE